jgi:hypothetical protein
MAEAPPQPARRGGPLGVLTQKAGPLPVWAWAALALVAFVLYRRMHKSSASTQTPGAAAPTDQTTYVPASTSTATPPGGGIGQTGLNPNDPFGAAPGAQALGGGTAPAPPRPGIGTPVNIEPINASPIVAPKPIDQGFGTPAPAPGGISGTPVTFPGGYVPASGRLTSGIAV